jgi:hypothetical protein
MTWQTSDVWVADDIFDEKEKQIWIWEWAKTQGDFGLRLFKISQSSL